MVPVGSRVTVRKLNLDGAVRIEYPAIVKHKATRQIILSAKWTHTGDFVDFAISAGAPVLEYFHSDLWYGVIRLMDFDRRLLGWYCDICMPPSITRSRGDLVVDYTDLDLDIFVSPSREVKFRDHEEFETTTLPRIGRTARWRCGWAVRHLTYAVRRRIGPFSSPG
ncbi:MAG: DUF402 domain-containing protein [Bacillota bacterium]